MSDVANQPGKNPQQRAADNARSLGPEPGPARPRIAPPTIPCPPPRPPSPAASTRRARNRRCASPPRSPRSGCFSVSSPRIFLYAPEIWQISSLRDLGAIPGALPTLIGILFPIMIFFAFASMIARAQELKNAARSMAEVALRLAEPESIAAERIMTVGQAVRREVSAMNEGIERTIARASELETLVHSEVNALERSYSDNELRVRSLVQELGSEREAIIGHAERVRPRSPCAGSVARRARQRQPDHRQEYRNSGEAVAQMIDTQAAIIMQKSGNVANTIGSVLSKKTEELVGALETSGLALTEEFDTRIETLGVTINERGNKLLSEFETRASMVDATTEKLNAALADRTRQLNETLIARTRQINETLTNSGGVISNSLESMLKSLNASLDQKNQSFRQALKTTADDAIMDLDVRTAFLDER